MIRYISTTLLGFAIDIVVVCSLVYLMSIGFDFTFDISLGLSVWALTMLIRWVLKFGRKAADIDTSD